MKFLVLSGLTIFSLLAQAQDDCRYPTYSRKLVGEVINKWTSDCKEVPLQFMSTPPDVWQGGYARDAQVVEAFQVKLYDECTGEVKKTSIEPHYLTRTYYFPIDNPNLDDANAPSYILNAPLTDEEAVLAMAATKKFCQEYPIGGVVDESSPFLMRILKKLK